MSSVLFICTANRFRSPIASAWFNRKLQQEAGNPGWHVSSAGTWAEPGLAVFPSPDWVKRNFGINLETHRSVRVNRQVLDQYDLILVMENGHQEALQVEFPDLKERVFMLTKVALGVAYDIHDPGVYQSETFLDVAQKLTVLIDEGFEKICLLANQLHRMD
jgi:protein-tyrosine-phosphatase